MSLIEPSSTLSSVAPIAGGRTTRPCSMPGSAEVLHVGEGAGHLVGNVDARHRLADELVILGVLAGDGLGVVELERKGLAADQLAVADASCRRRSMTPSAILSCSLRQRRDAWRPRRAAPPVAVAAAWRSCMPPIWIDRLPQVVPWSGVSAVSPWMSVDHAQRHVELLGDDLRATPSRRRCRDRLCRNRPSPCPLRRWRERNRPR